MAFSEEELLEFHTEASELLDAAEQSLIAIDQGGSFGDHYDSIFRVFHSLKGAASMMELFNLQSHMHQLENILTQTKDHGMSKEEIEFFLKGTDVSRQILEGHTVEFDYNISSKSQSSGVSETSQNEPATPPAPAPAEAAPVDTKEKQNRIGKAIVIDDEIELTEILSALLEDAGFEVSSFTDPEMALGQIKNFQPDVIISDISMPKLDGINLLKKVRVDHPDLPFIFVSGYVTKESLMEALDLDAYGVIEKPFQAPKVIEMVLNATKKYQIAKLLNSSINLIMYQYSDIDSYLQQQGREDVRNTLKKEIENLIEQRRKIRSMQKFKGS